MTRQPHQQPAPAFIVQEDGTLFGGAISVHHLMLGRSATTSFSMVSSTGGWWLSSLGWERLGKAFCLNTRRTHWSCWRNLWWFSGEYGRGLWKKPRRGPLRGPVVVGGPGDETTWKKEPRTRSGTGAAWAIGYCQV